MKKGFDKKQIKKELEAIWLRMGCFTTIKDQEVKELEKRERILKKRLGER